MTNSLIVYNDFGQIQQAAGALYESGYFSDARSKAQAIVKVMAGAEIGLPAFASMTGIHIIQGKPTLGANVIATLIKNDPRYNYRVAELTDAVCRIEFFENGYQCGVSEFTAQDARKAGTKNMEKFPKNMLFARAISNGAKWFTPGIFGGAPVYTPDELGADVDEDGNVVEGSYTVPTPVKSPTSDFAVGDEVMVQGQHDEKPGIVTAVNGVTVTVSVDGKEIKVKPERLTLIGSQPEPAAEQDDLFGEDATYQD